MKRLTLILILLLTHLSVNASTTYGAGSASCGTWLKHSKVKGSNYAFNISWVHGYLSAIQVNYELKEVDTDSITIFLDNYCTKHPFASISEATHELTLEIIQ
ncbi:hypothetical protein HB762_28110 (plasmid) [Vibrio campbellii]|uniref:Uncharacterized protein n=1 Tax=Vibrio campbellii TaxID=680 RepID=A0ABY5IQM9_9VIBR|nr:hypothetical protein [Vibrio campbellii]UTZ35038.1 hypothetical protein HB762_27630 [Vibrio campbellii]UTZ35129.1 hypothetical protein HB762_28110 [Vibrio campbellii]